MFRWQGSYLSEETIVGGGIARRILLLGRFKSVRGIFC